jgi:hypothetical protein
MSFSKKAIFFSKNKNSVGGRQKAPPTPCLRSACVDAYAPAYVERTEPPERGAKLGQGLTSQVAHKNANLRWRLAV